MEELIAALRGIGHEVLLVGPESFARADFGHDPKLLSWFKARMPKAVYELLEIAYNVPAYFRLRRAFREFRPDFVYERYNLYLLAGIWLKGATRIPFLLEVNAPLTDERSADPGLGLKRTARRLEQRIWQSADFVLPVTHVLANEIEASGVRRENIVVIANAIDPLKFRGDADNNIAAKAAMTLSGKTVLGFTGFVRDWHGLDAVIELLSQPDMRDVYLVVAGDGPAIPGLKAQARRLSVSDRIIFPGIVDRAHIAGFVAAFDIALQPKSVAYASPLKLFEYMALGKAIVAPDQPNIREVLDNEISALLFEPDNRAQMAAAIKRLILDKSLRKRLGEGAQRAIVAKDLTWTGNAKRVAALAETVQSRRRP